eukprot:TRINITY_DN22419_c0_g1_i1.p1 TRINITY_DN22419_c0_g1~~TRINITY_DN22419_c0_g1_i1.p1  ORF type:complete len:341 (+),score=85.35 TRINITY_DN22419_c0_g1_i1:78-1100(+)
MDGDPGAPQDRGSASPTPEAHPALNVGAVVAKLLEARSRKVDRNKPYVPEGVIYDLLTQVRDVLLQQGPLLHLDAPVKISGDVHGQFHDLLRLFELGGHPPETNYLFLGDYVDRGCYSVECACLMFAYKLAYPENFFLLRGNHETSTPNLQKWYGFLDECKRRYSVKLWKRFNDVFLCLPFSAVVADRIFCMHGGIPRAGPEWTIATLNDIRLPIGIPQEGVLHDLLWADPMEKGCLGYEFNHSRQTSWMFGEDVAEQFLADHDLDLIVRAHQVVSGGYEFPFTHRHVVTLFGAPNYTGEFDNAAAIMAVDAHLRCSFQILRPRVRCSDLTSDAKRQRLR